MQFSFGKENQVEFILTNVTNDIMTNCMLLEEFISYGFKIYNIQPFKIKTQR